MNKPWAIVVLTTQTKAQLRAHISPTATVLHYYVVLYIDLETGLRSSGLRPRELLAPYTERTFIETIDDGIGKSLDDDASLGTISICGANSGGETVYTLSKEATPKGAGLLVTDW